MLSLWLILLWLAAHPVETNWPGDYGSPPGTPVAPPIPVPPLQVSWDPQNPPPIYGPFPLSNPEP